MMFQTMVAGFMISSTAFCATLHVSPSGSDANNGGSDTPLMSVQKAADLARAGDTVVLHAGEYPIAQAVLFRQSGNPDQWITFRAGDGERVILDASLKQMRPELPRKSYIGAVEISGVSYLRFIGIEVRDAWSFAFRIGGDNTHHIELLDCRVDRSYGPGIWLGKSENCRIIGCQISRANDIDARLPGTRRPDEAPHEALSIAQARHFEVAYNHVHHCYKEGIDCKETSSHGKIHHNLVHNCARQGLYVDCWFGLLEDVEFAYNSSHDNEWGLAVSAEGKDASMHNIRIHHNTIYRNRASGIFFGLWGINGLRSDIEITHNTVVQNGSLKHWAGDTGGIDLRADNLHNILIANNIVYQNAAFEIATFAAADQQAAAFVEKQINITNNLTGPFMDQITAGGMFPLPHAYSSPLTLVGDPIFATPKVGDFRLRPGSPAANAAQPIGRDATPHIGAEATFVPLP